MSEPQEKPKNKPNEVVVETLSDLKNSGQSDSPVSTSEVKKNIEFELESEKKKNADLTKRMMYLQADMINLQRQNERRLLESKAEIALRYIEEIISIKEDLERAVRVAKDHSATRVLDGLRMVISRVEGTLRAEEVQRIEVAPGSEFDINLHEAVAYSGTQEFKEGTVVSVISNGYTLKGKVIKPVLVEVAAHQGQAKRGVDEEEAGEKLKDFPQNQSSRHDPKSRPEGAASEVQRESPSTSVQKIAQGEPTV